LGRIAFALSRLGPLLGFGMMVVAYFLLEKAFKEYGTREVIAHLKGMHFSSIWMAACLTILCQGVLTAYDALAAQCLGPALPYRRTALAAFLGYAFSHSLGFSMISGAPVRYRLYSAWGVSAKNVTSIVALNCLSWCLGLMAVGGSALVLFGMPLPPEAEAGVLRWRLLGILCLLVVAAYLFLRYRGRPFRVSRWNLLLPRLRTALLQVGVACMDWSLTAGVLYVLLPAKGTAFGPFLGIFSVAQAAGLVSQIPAGLGILDTAVIALLPSSIPKDSALSALVAFRLIYTLAPLAITLGLLAVFEVRRRIGALNHFRPAEEYCGRG